MSTKITVTFTVEATSEAYSVGLHIDGGLPLKYEEIEKYNQLANEATESPLMKFMGEKLMEAEEEKNPTAKPKKVIWEG